MFNWIFDSNFIPIILFIIIGIIVICLLFWGIYGIVWCFTPWNKAFNIKGTVKTIMHIPEIHGTGIGVAGQGPAVISTTTEEKYDVVIKLENGEPWIIDDEKFFIDAEVGKSYIFTVRNKTIFGANTDCDLISWKLNLK